MGRRISMEVSEESYLDFLPRGRRNGYIKSRVDRHLVQITSELNSLLETYSTSQAIKFIEEADTPVARFDDTYLSSQPWWVRRAVMSLWREQRLTGLEQAELIEALQSGRSV